MNQSTNELKQRIQEAGEEVNKGTKSAEEKYVIVQTSTMLISSIEGFVRLQAS